MTYDGLSRRIAKKVEQQNAVTLIWTVVEYQGYLYDGWNCIMCVRLNNDATANTPPTVRGRLASYVWGPDIGSNSRQGANWQTAGGVGGLLFVSQGTNVDTSYTGTPAYDAFYADSFFPLWDRMGNITGYRKASTSTTDSALATTGAMLDYDAFGKEIRSSGPAADKIPFHFSSKFTDIETGLNYYGYRYYDPVNGRWLGRDPIGEEGGENLYRMVGNSTPRLIDNRGLDVIVIYDGGDEGGGIRATGTDHARIAKTMASKVPDGEPSSNAIDARNLCQALSKLAEHIARKTNERRNSQDKVRKLNEEMSKKGQSGSFPIPPDFTVDKLILLDHGSPGNQTFGSYPKVYPNAPPTAPPSDFPWYGMDVEPEDIPFDGYPNVNPIKSIAELIKTDGILHLCGCNIADGEKGSKYIQDLANYINRRVKGGLGIVIDGSPANGYLEKNPQVFP